jgi:hypothetical protein
MSWIETLSLGCALLGGAVLVIQTVMSLFGGDHGDMHHDVGDPAGHDAAANLISVRSVSAFIAFFGLTSWGCLKAGWNPYGALGAGLVAGLVMLIAVALLFRLPSKMHSEGNLEPANAVGQVAHVYLRIPGQNSGKGKITLVLQGRTAEFHACTRGAEIPTGAEVRIAKLITSDTFEVEGLA